MKRYIKSSAGDINLYKFILIPMPVMQGLDEGHYDNRLSGYFYLWDYTYNTITHHTDDRMYSHSNVIDNLPNAIKQNARQLTVWGKTDYYKNGIRFTIVNDEYITQYQVDRIKSYCKL